MTGRARICIVAHFAYGALAGGRGGHVGGVERQTSMLAKWLAARGHATTMLTWDEGQEDGIEIDGVRVLKLCRRDAGLPGLRFVTPRWTSLNDAMRRADADVYYQNCAECVTGQVALFCRCNGRRFVYSVASDADCDASLPELKERRVRALYRYGVDRADRIIVQTRAQQERMADSFGRGSIVLPMPCARPEGAQSGLLEREAPPRRVLWAGRIAPVKRFELLLETAALVPEIVFDVAGPPDADASYVQPLLARARALPNVVYHGRVAREDMAALYRGAAALVCTSWLEGFPNTFLEAWGHGRPAISTVDPDGVIAEHGIGRVITDAASTAAAIRGLLSSEERWRASATAARRYFDETHAIERAMPRFEEALLDVVGASRVSAREEIAA